MNIHVSQSVKKHMTFMSHIMLFGNVPHSPYTFTLAVIVFHTQRNFCTFKAHSVVTYFGRLTCSPKITLICYNGCNDYLEQKKHGYRGQFTEPNIFWEYLTKCSCPSHPDNHKLYVTYQIKFKSKSFYRCMKHKKLQE